MKNWFSRNPEKKAVTPHLPSAVLTPTTCSLAEAMIVEGQRLEDDGSIDAALAQYCAAIDLEPTLASGWLNKGNALQLQEKFAEAVESYQSALALDAKNAGGWLNLGNALLKLPAYTQETHKAAVAKAEAAYRTALAERPGWAEAWFGIGCALEVSLAAEEACTAYRKVLEANPNHEGAAFNLSDLTVDMMVKRREITAARKLLLDTLQRSPGQRRLISRLADIERASGRLREGLTHLRNLVAERPDEFVVHSIMLFTMNFEPELSVQELYEAHRRFGQVMEQRIVPVQTAVSRAVGRRLRIGYVSPDFRKHAVAVFIIPVLSNHDHSRFEVYCYHCHQGQDEITEVIRGLSDHWRDVAKLGDDAVAQQIIDDQIDILIDLTGHTGEGRLSLFARKPAPVQMTWLGYLGTTGLTRIDYRICDFHTDPPGQAEQWHTEALLRMPDTQWCYEPQNPVPPPGPLPYLARGYWTFGSYNNVLKLNSHVFRSTVLKQFPTSRLKIFSIENDEIHHWVRVSLAKHGITADRIDLIGRIPIGEYFASAHDVDIALDSFPYTGGTTTCDTLLMGLPVATIAGQRTIARSGVSLLNAVGLEDWIAPSARDLPDLLKQQLADPEKIAVLRAELPARVRASPLMDAPRFVGHLEDHFHTAWQHWVASS